MSVTGLQKTESAPDGSARGRLASARGKLAQGGTPKVNQPKSRRKRSVASWLAPILVFAVIIGIWYYISDVVLSTDLQFLLPPPHQIVTQAFLDPDVRQELLKALGLTTQVALTGLACAIVIGVGWGVLMSVATWAERALFPYAVLLQCVPILALVPLMGFWFGFGFFSRVVVCVLIALFPMVSNTLFGLQSVDRGQLELFKLQKADRLTVLFKLQFPAALPAIFAGMRISAGLSVVGAIVADFSFRQGQAGIGILISNYTSRLQGPQLFAAIIVAAVLGFVIFWIFGRLRTMVVGRWYDVSADGN
ncbi:ABC transporter permease [Nakamurella sp. PAMC28650]|uniref:ABC transporter permease n=1 Tax=Nakamurella sp. PAMC28650 TaxID=2762325 RepID=UPI00164E3B80|nr:ABC transporter permease [Nakamurella sp. PAMC28650]QNK81229.1 ABC transporter permease [Nakamurella sp. PAMC28650]